MDKLFRAPEAFEFEGNDAAQRWNRWEKGFRTFFIASEYKKKPKDIQVAILLNCAGTEAQEIHETFQFDDEEDKKNIDKVLEKFEEYCNPRKNIVYERYKFNSRKQLGDEPVDRWVKDLRTIATNCEFGEQEDSLIRDRIVFGVRDDRTKERMLRETDLPLKKSLDICRAAESTKTQMREMTRVNDDGTNVHEMNFTTASNAGRRGPSNNNNSNNNSNNNNGNNNSNNWNQCYNCSGYGHLSRDCPSGDNFPRGRRGRGRNSNRGNRGGRSRAPGRSRGRRYQVNQLEGEQHDVDYDDYEEQFQSMNLHSVTSESNERGRASTRGNRGGRSCGHTQGHRGAQEQFQEQFQTLTLDSVAVESVTGRKRKRQRFA